jgi:hypothetical protein
MFKSVQEKEKIKERKKEKKEKKEREKLDKKTKKIMKREISDILCDFNRQLPQIIKIVQKIENNNTDIESFKRKLQIIRSVNPSYIMECCVDGLWEYKQKIIDRDTEFFINMEYGEYLEGGADEQLMTRIINLFKIRYRELSNCDAIFIWDRINTMLQYVIQYRIRTADYKNNKVYLE